MPVLPLKVPLFVQSPARVVVLAPPFRTALKLIVRLPAMVMLREKEVVPPEMTRLLKLMLLLFGIVFVAVISIVPVPAVHVPSRLSMNPSQRSVPPDAIVSEPGVLVVTPSVTAPLTVSWEPPLNASVPLPVPSVLPPSWMLRHAAFDTSTVTVNPPFTMTSSPATGAGFPPQVVVALQLPDCDVILVAATSAVPS